MLVSANRISPGTVSGFGLAVGRRGKRLLGGFSLTLLVATLPAQGPASQSQINLNDYIHELNGLTVHSMSVQDVVNEILVRMLCAPMRCSAGPPMCLYMIVLMGL